MTEFHPAPGHLWSLGPDLALLLAPNPSPMTQLGTNTYILGYDKLVIIDPGLQSDTHLAALIRVIADRPVSHILLTHSHLDHSPLARPLAKVVNAPICAFGPSEAGQSRVMQQLAAKGLTGGGEGIDHDFTPDLTLHDGQVVGDLRAIHTPGHIGNHLCFAWQDAVFTGDHVMGWASTFISPPDGDVTDFMASCAKLQKIATKRYYPGHGAPIMDPKARLAWLINHRQSRTAQIMDRLSNIPTGIPALTRAIYTDLAPTMLPAAQRNVFAHLIALVSEGRATAHPTLASDATFTKNTVE